ncbi:hypothetical protein C7M61_002767 [Candidozyma pseudohaemuli]|uniref:Class E vacuolar protein-sorting machinery protein HSE1 n=1 Tax=Candidozyma pseudohaemuli TaxID=418784 RepID=A0A2P7YQE7_9ASCO|nr:hypothetical protein C7M61_002767 [[Candida] pseudohaemulonii]PSK38211.1 hypothetical protein C7M61_002767 [[Candida] pseudohaemulonii]
MSSLKTQIDKATDCTLTDDNWQFILDVCDTISKDPEKNSKDAISFIRSRLSTRDANTLFRTLSLIVAIAENCGSRLQQEIASTSFLQESVLSKLSDKKVHKQVKVRITEVIAHLNKTFKNDPSLRPIQDALQTVRTKYPQYCKGAPSKPAKTAIPGKVKEQEEQELERALQLSVQEYEREQSVRKINIKNEVADMPHESRESVLKDRLEPMTIANVKKVRALYDLISYEPDELSFKKGDIIIVVESVYRDWWRGALPNGKVGIFPLNYVTPVVSKTPEEAAREASVEERLLKVEQLKIDELLALISSDPLTLDEDRVTDLYNDVLPLRPSLAKAIEKYGTRRDELTVLHDRTSKATYFYDSLIDKAVHHSGEFRASDSLPYPSGGRLVEPPALQQQLTSSGFGNQGVDNHFNR